MSKKTPQIRFKGFTDDWEDRKLGELASFSKGNGYTKNDLVEFGDPIILYGRLYTKYETVIEKVDTFVNKKDKSIISEGSEVIVPASGESSEDISRASVVGKSGIILGGDLNIIKPVNYIDSIFLALTISNGSQQKEMSKRAQGKSVVHLHNSDLKQVNILYPKLEEQQKIGSFFKQLDNTIALHQRKLDLLKEQKKGFLQKMFPKNGAKIPELRFAGFADDWEERKLKDVVEKQIKGKAQFEKLAPGEVEYLDTSRLNGGQAILTNGLKDVTLDDILILWDGSKAGTVYHGFEGALGSTLKAYRTSANSKFVYQYLKRHQDNIYNNYRTPNIPHVQKDFLNVFTISVPVSDEQEKIGSFFNELDYTITLHQCKLDLLKEQKKGFLQKMFVS
ncbi:restriction endonuclease subunit S [Leuconostoc mesenteroides]|uniref:restriction endonuclease subunit S n=1 Tax=Leuconostoc mesenteroides TaxID=1245 RepID=UPI0020737B6C|nr:restriction endonuclease subunit S [Leuconostoc mesenteroides]MCM6832621.1 restriction endonuclease subunit S [Leuconostoc mesenteroides]